MLLPLVVAQIGVIGVPAALTFELSRHSDKRRRIIASGTRVLSAQAVLLTVVGTVTLITVGSALELAGELMAIAAFGVVSSVTQQYGLALLQGRQSFRQFNVARLGQPTVYAIGIVMLMVSGSATVASVLAVWIFGSLAVGVTTLWYALRHTEENRSGSSVSTRELLHLGLRSMVGTVAPLEAFRIDQFAVALLLPAEELGLYVVALSLTNLARFVGQSIGMIGYPAVAGQPTRKAALDAQRQYVGITVLAAGSVSLLVGLAAAWLVPAAFGREYSGAIPVTYWLVLASFATAVRRVIGDTSRGRGNPLLGSAGEILALVLVLGGVLAMAGYGAVGIAASVTVASVVSTSVIACLALSGASVTAKFSRTTRRLRWSAQPPAERTAE